MSCSNSNFKLLFLSGIDQNQNQTMNLDGGAIQDETIESVKTFEQNENIAQNERLDLSETMAENNTETTQRAKCTFCSGMYRKDSIKRHSMNCELYQKLIKNGSECSVCEKTFEFRKELNQHIRHNHKAELNKLFKNEGMFNSVP